MQSTPTSSSPAFDPSEGHHIDERLLREAAVLSPKASVAVIRKLTSKLPTDFYATLTPRQRFEAARGVWDSQVRQCIADKKEAARRAAVAADNAKAESVQRVVDLEKQLEAANRVSEVKTKEVEAAVERSVAAMAGTFTTASNVWPDCVRASDSAAATPQPEASSENSSQPACPSAKDAPKPVNNKGRTRPWNKKGCQ